MAYVKEQNSQKEKIERGKEIIWRSNGQQFLNLINCVNLWIQEIQQAASKINSNWQKQFHVKHNIEL